MQSAGEKDWSKEKEELLVFAVEKQKCCNRPELTEQKGSIQWILVKIVHFFENIKDKNREKFRKYQDFKKINGFSAYFN